MLKRYTHYVAFLFKKLSLIIPVIKRTFVQNSNVCPTKSSNFFYSSVLALLLLVVGVGSVSGVTKTWSGGNGNWNTPASWSPSGVPANTDDVVINSTGTVTLNVNAICNNFTLNAGTFRLNNATSYTLTINGNYSQTSGTFDFNHGNSGTSTMYLAGNFTQTSGAISMTTTGTVANGTIVFNKIGTQTISFSNSTGADYVKYSINSTSTLQLLSNFALIKSSNNIYAGEITVNGTLDLGTFTLTQAGGTAGAAIFTLNSGATLISANAGGVDGSVSSTNITRNLSTSANFIYNGSVAQVTSVGMPITVNNLTIKNNSNTVTLSAATTISGNLLISAGTFSANNLNMTVGGNWTNNGGTFTPGTGTVTFNGNNSAIMGTVGTQNFNNLIVNMTGGQTLSVAGNTTTLTVGGTFTETLGNFTAPTTMSVGSDITLNTGTFTAGTNLSVAGSWYNNGATFTAGTGTVTMKTTGKTIGGGASTTFNNLTLGTGGGEDFLLGFNEIVNGVLIINNNTLLTLGSNNLTLGALATISIGSPNNACMIVADGTGQVQKIISANGSFTFPIGDNTSGADYSPITLNFTSGTYAVGAYVGVNVKNAKHPQNSSPVSYLNRYWTVSQSGITSFLCTVTGTFVNTDVSSYSSPQNAVQYVGVLPWIPYSPLGASTLTATGVTTLGAFTGMALPTFTTNKTSLPGFTYVHGTGPSGNQSFYVNSTNLTSPFIVTPSADFEVCLTPNGAYQSTQLTLPQANGVVNNVPVYVRLKAGLAVGTYLNESIICSSTGAANINVIASGTVTAATYCSVSGDNSVHSITLVNFNTLNNTSSKVTGGYSDLTSQSTNVLVGSTYPFTVNINTSNGDAVYATVYIDWNGDGDFLDAGETYNLGSTTVNGKTSLCPLSITVPAGASVGSTRMRVMCNYYQAVFGSCSGENGEIEDFTLNIFNPVIVTSTSTLSGFNYVVQKGPSGEQSFTVTGTGLSSNIVVAPPTPTSDFEISTLSGGIFQSTPITLTQVGGNVNVTIYVRMIAGNTAGSYGPENITLTSTSAITKNVSCSGYVVPAITVGGGGSYCSTQPINLTSTAVNYSNIYWEGPNNFYLANSTSATIPNPLIAANAGTYTVTATFVDPAAPNLVVNGDFETGTPAGNDLTQYQYMPTSAHALESMPGTHGSTSGEGNYAVCNIPYNVHSAFSKNLPESGNFQMVVNGSSVPTDVVWGQTISNIQPNTTYQFSYWEQSAVAGTPSKLKLYANGSPAFSQFTAPIAINNWQQYFYTWNSGSSTSVALTLQDAENSGGGNDFALDNIVFQKAYASSSSVNVSVIMASSPASVSVSASANPVSNGQSVTFTATPTNGGTNPTYQWSVGGVPVTNATNSTYTYVPVDGAVVSCAMTSNSGCLSSVGAVTSSVTMTVYNIVNYWKGTNGTDWGTASNWTVGIPADGDNVVFATTSTPYGDAKNNLILDKDRTIGNLTNTSTKSLVIPTATSLTVNGNITTNGASSPGSIIIKAYPDGTQQNGSLIFPTATDVYGTVEMYSHGHSVSTAVEYPAGSGNKYRFSWQYFGIPVEDIDASPTFDGSYVRKLNEADPNPSTHWIQLGNTDKVSPFIGYEITQDVSTGKLIVFQGKLINRDFTSDALIKTTANTAFGGQYVFANPYTAAIDIKSFISRLTSTSTDILTTIYLYSTGSYIDWYLLGNQGVQNGINAGQYQAATSLYSSGMAKQIPSMQAILIYANLGNKGTASQVTFKYSDIVKNNELQRVKSETDGTSSGSICTRIDVVGSHYSDRMWIFSDTTFTRNYDRGYDGAKMFGIALAPQLYAQEKDGIYQIDAVNDMNNTNLGFKPGVDSEYTFIFTHENTDKRYSGIYLLDSQENKVIDITASGSEYKFVVDTTATYSNRFKIVTQNYDQSLTENNSKVKIFTANGTFFVQNLSEDDGEFKLFDIGGRQLKMSKFGPNAVTEVANINGSGVYIGRAVTTNENVTKQLIVH